MVFEKIREIICEQFELEPESVTGETRFVEDLSADSLDVVELIMSMEDAFHLPEVSEDDIRSIQTVDDLVRYVSKIVG